MRGLVVGRFQPLHLGHVALVRAALERCSHVVVGIGSSQARPSLRNPFSLDERREMLQAAFSGELAAGQVSLVAIPDLNDPLRWVDRALGIAGGVEVVYGNDDPTLDLFEGRRMPAVRPGLVKRESYAATEIRRLMAEDDPAWRRCVPAGVAALLDAWGAASRLRAMA